MTVVFTAAPPLFVLCTTSTALVGNVSHKVANTHRATGRLCSAAWPSVVTVTRVIQKVPQKRDGKIIVPPLRAD